VILSCLTLPARLLSAVIVAGLLYLGWVNRDELRRWVHRATAESAGPGPATIPAVPPAELGRQARAKLDSLAGGRADSIVLGAAEFEVLIAEELARQGPRMVDSVSLELGEGRVAVRGQVDASRLPPGSLGPLADWIKGRQSVEASGPLNLLRVGTVEWRVDQVRIRGLPLPAALRERLLGLVLPGSNGSLRFPVDRWISGVRVSRGHAVLYGRSER
jgi:hypothetical protein